MSYFPDLCYSSFSILSQFGKYRSQKNASIHYDQADFEHDSLSAGIWYYDITYYISSKQAQNVAFIHLSVRLYCRLNHVDLFKKQYCVTPVWNSNRAEASIRLKRWTVRKHANAVQKKENTVDASGIQTSLVSRSEK